MKHSLLYFMMAVCLFAACGEDDLKPSAPQQFYEFPQGDADYDQDILAYYEAHGVQFIYDYTEAAFRWNITDYIPFYSTPAEEAYRGEAFHFVADKCFSIWDEDFLNKLLPTYVYLASEIYNVTEKQEYVYNDETLSWGYVTVLDTNYCASTYGLNHVSFGYASEKINELTPEEELDAIGDVAKSLIAFAASRDKIEIPSAFADLFTRDYTGEDLATYVGGYGYNASGFLEYYADIDVNYDFGLYVKYLVTMSEEDFKAWALSDTFDVNGVWDQSIGEWGDYRQTHLIQQKYEAVIDYFKNTLGIDLHAIGNQISAQYK